MKFLNSSNLIKVSAIFFIGFIYRIIIFHYFDVNVFSDYTNNLSILYYISLSFFSVYFDQLFSFNLLSSTNVESINKTFNDNLKINNLVFTKDHNSNFTSNQSTGHQPFTQKVKCKLSWYSLGKDKAIFGSYEEYKLNWDPKTSVWKEVKNLVKRSFHWIDNKSTGIMDPGHIEDAQEMRRKKYFFETKRLNEMYRKYR